MKADESLTVRIVRLFTTSHLSLLFLIISLLAGAVALGMMMLVLRRRARRVSQFGAT